MVVAVKINVDSGSFFPMTLNFQPFSEYSDLGPKKPSLKSNLWGKSSQAQIHKKPSSIHKKKISPEIPPSSSPKAYRYLTFTKESNCFSFKPTTLKIGHWTLCINHLLSYHINWSLPNQTSHVNIQCFHHFWKSLHPFLGCLRGFENGINKKIYIFYVHLLTVLQTEKTFTKCLIESFNISLTVPESRAISTVLCKFSEKPLKLPKTLWKWVVQRFWICWKHRACQCIFKNFPSSRK